MKSEVHVITLADENFVLPLAVLVRSMLDHLAAEREIRLIVIDGGISDESRTRLTASWNDARLRVSWRTPGYGGASSLPVSGRIPPLTYARLMAPSLLPEGCRRAIVLDADQLVLKDLGLLADAPFHGACVLAPRDMFIPTVGSINGLAGYAHLGLAPGTPYLSGAVMVIDVAAWGRENVSERTLAFVAENAHQLRAFDQDALNAVLKDRWLELDPRWQVQPRALGLRPSVTPHLDGATRATVAADPWIVHFSGRLKPWLYRGRTRFDHMFRETLSRTGFADYRTPRTLQAMAFRLYDGVLRRLFYSIEVRLDQTLREFRRRHAPSEPRP